MTPDQQTLADACTNLQRLTVLGVIAGKTQRQAYYDAGGTAETDETADAVASRMLSDAKVKAFHDAMLAQALEDAIWTRRDSLQTLADIANGHDEQGKTSDRVSAVKELNAMRGWSAPAKIDLTSSDGSMSQKPTTIQLVAKSKDERNSTD